MIKQTPFFWYKKNALSHIISYLLLPFSFLYLAIVALRHFCYARGYLKITNFSAPIIVVGNITVGGTGKTPLVIWMANFLQQNKYRVGVVSRGYGGKGEENNSPILVTAQSDPQLVGDEALLIARQTQCPIFVAKNRVEAVRALLKHTACDVVLSDDGLQHYALGRTIEVAVVDGVRQLGNGFCLPSGPLREPVSRLKEVDFVVKNSGVISDVDKYTMHFVPQRLYNLQNPNLTKDLSEFRNIDVHAIVGIGNPTNFFQLLHFHEIKVCEHIFPDHYSYTASDLEFGAGKNDMIIMTEKDAVKCERFAKDNWWVLPIEVEVSEKFRRDLLQLVSVSSSYHYP